MPTTTRKAKTSSRRRFRSTRSAKPSRQTFAQAGPNGLSRVTNRVNTGPVHSFTQKVFQSTYSITSVVTVDTSVSFSFVLTDLAANVTSLSNLYDQYRIRRVRVFIDAMTNISPPVAAAGNPVSLLLVAVDFDDAAAITKAQILGYENVQVVVPGSSIQLDLVPRIAVAAYSGTFTSYSNQTSWIDCSSQTVQHYGVKVVATAALGTATVFPTWAIHFEYLVDFRNVR